MSKKSEEKIIKETKYCKIISQGKVGEGEYTYSIEKIYIKELKRDEVRFCVYKATRRGDETYIILMLLYINNIILSYKIFIFSR